jgi:hypothetical protein
VHSESLLDRRVLDNILALLPVSVLQPEISLTESIGPSTLFIRIKIYFEDTSAEVLGVFRNLKTRWHPYISLDFHIGSEIVVFVITTINLHLS